MIYMYQKILKRNLNIYQMCQNGSTVSVFHISGIKILFIGNAAAGKMLSKVRWTDWFSGSESEFIITLHESPSPECRGLGWSEVIN